MINNKDEQENILLEIINLKKYFSITKGFFKKTVGNVKAVDNVSYNINKSETMGLVGESGCGKTTTGRLIMGGLRPTAGNIIFYDGDKAFDITKLNEKQLRDYWQKTQMIFQDPFSSLNPRMTVMQIIGEPLMCLNNLKKQAIEERVNELLKTVGLNSQYGNRYPHAFSGGQRQRIGIARALALKPDLIVADEPVSALDVSIQAQIINLMEDLQSEFALSYLFIAHDLGVVKHISDKIAVMYVGKLVEYGKTTDIFENPLHPYTEALLSSVPRPDPDSGQKRIKLPGDVADPSNRPTGCCFHPRCRYAKEICKNEEPSFKDIDKPENKREHYVACHYASDLLLKGVDYNRKTG